MNSSDHELSPNVYAASRRLGGARKIEGPDLPASWQAANPKEAPDKPMTRAWICPLGKTRRVDAKGHTEVWDPSLGWPSESHLNSQLPSALSPAEISDDSESEPAVEEEAAAEDRER